MLRCSPQCKPRQDQKVPFTTRTKLGAIEGLRIRGVALHATSEAKYLSVIRDSKLSWKKHLQGKCSKVVQAF